LFTAGREENEAFKEFVVRYTKTISAYYDVIRYRNASIHFLSKIRKGMNALSNMNKDSAGKAKLGIKHQASLIDDLLSSIIKEKINKISLANYLARQRKEDVTSVRQSIKASYR
jgi:hypothetical protein